MSEEATAEATQGNTETAAANEPWLPEDLRENEALADFKEPGELAKAYVDKLTALSELEGQEKPPEKPDDYKLELEDKDALKNMQALAHKSGLTQSQAANFAKELQEINTQLEADQEKALTEAREAAETSLKKDWGDGFDGNLEAAKKVVRTLGDENFAKWLDETALGDVVPFVRFAHKVSTLLSEDSLVEGGHKAEPKNRNEEGDPVLHYPTMEKGK